MERVTSVYTLTYWPSMICVKMICNYLIRSVLIQLYESTNMDSLDE